MSTETLDLPLILQGRQLLPGEGRPTLELEYESGLRVRLPAVDEADLARIVDDRERTVRALRQLTTDEVTLFLGAAGDLWMSRRARGRRLVEAYAARATGFPPAMLTEDYDTIGQFMVQRFHTFDQIAAEFGHERMLDEWIPLQAAHVKAFPRGLALQVLVGNLPLAAMYSLLRGIITRNATVAKIPSRDPVTALGFLQAIVETDPDHPIARSLSAAYWPHASAVGDGFLRAADAVCVWGGADAVESVKRKVRANVPVAEYGPRWSASVIDLDACDPAEAAARLAEDVCFYDQEACFNTQRAFVRGDVGAFRGHLRAALDRFAARFPLSTPSRDALAHRSATLLEARYGGLEVDGGDHWAVVVVPGPSRPRLDHPLTRTLFLHRVSDLEEVAPELDGRSQTLSVFPWSATERLRDAWAGAGADRIVELGWNRLPRAGWTHDGTWGMHPLVRIVSLERPRSEFGKYYPRPEQVRTWQRSYFSGEKWWAEPWWSLAQPGDLPTR